MVDNTELEVEVLAAGDAAELALSSPLVGIGEPTEAQVAEINRRMPLVPVKAEDLFVWPVQAINNRMTSYFFWVDESSLANFNTGANAGRGYSYMRNHRTGGFAKNSEDPHGRVFAGVLVDQGPRQIPKVAKGDAPLARDIFRPEGNALVLVEMVYMPRGITVNGINNDDLIRNLETGVQASNSIGFGMYSPLEPGSYYRCDITGLDWLRTPYEQMPYMPGVQYEVPHPTKPDQKIVVTHTMGCVGAQQNELSGVYLGAAPDSFSVRGAQLFKGGKLSHADGRMLEERYQLQRGRIVGDLQAISIPKPAAGRAAPTNGGDSMDEAMKAAVLARVRELFKGDVDRLAALELHGADADPVAALGAVLKAEVDVLTKAAAEAKDTLAAHVKAEGEWLGLAAGDTVAVGRARKDELAKLGQEMKGELEAECLRQMTRAGLTYVEADERALMATWSPTQLKAKAAQLKTTADKEFPPGRLSEPELRRRDGEETRTNQATRSVVPV